MQKRKPNKRSLARLCAVQALYQMDIGKVSLEKTLKEFTLQREGAELDNEQSLPADHDYFAQIVTGVTKYQLKIDPLIDKILRDDWPVTRIDSILRAILRAASFELLYKKSIPKAVIISEYMEIADAFFEGNIPKMVNGVLDRLANSQQSEQK